LPTDDFLYVEEKSVLISNPKTGRYVSRRKTIQELVSDLNSRGVEVELKLTAGPGNAAELAAQAARNGSTDVIVAGGDGTINEAIQGMVGTNARLGILPAWDCECPGP
jgi:diacylglycerol kinase family enzyme